MPEDPNVGTAYVSLIPSAKGFGPAVSKSIGGPVEKEAAAAGAAGGNSLQKGLLGKTLGTGPKLLKNLGIIAIGAEAFHAAHAVEDANNIIIRSTGASGKAAEGLEASFKRVAGNTPASFETVATALSQVYQRTGLTGKGLEDLTLKVVTFNRITKDSPVDVRELTKTLAGFNVPAGKMSGSLDQLYVISQKTGVPLADLVSQLGSAGPIARQFGFSMNFTAGFLAQLNKAGIDGSSIMPGLRKAFVTFAKEGKSPAKGLRETFGALDALIKKGNITGAQKIAVKLFGARGAGLVDAAVQGKVSLQSLTKTFAPMGDGILKTASKTGTLGGKLGKLRNIADLALSSLGKPILAGAASALSFLMPVFTGLGNALEKIPGPLKSVIVGLLALALLAGPIKKFFTAFKTGFQALGGLFKEGGLLTNPFFLWIAGITIVVVLIVKFRKQILAVLKVIGAAFVVAGKAIGRFFVGIGKWLFNAGKAVVHFFTSLPGKVLGFAKRFFPLIIGILFPPAGIVLALIKFWGPISHFFGTLGSAILRLVAGSAMWLFNIGKDIVIGLWKGLLAYVSFVWRFWTSLPGTILRLLARAGSWLYGVGRSILTGLWNGLKFVGGLVWRWFSGLPGFYLRALGKIGSFLFNAGKTLLTGLWNGLKAIGIDVFNFFKNLPGEILKALGDLSKVLWDAGKALIGGLLGGIKHAVGGVFSFMGGIASKIAHIKGPLDKDRVLLVPHGGAIMSGLIAGLKGEEKRLLSQLGQITGHFTSFGADIAHPTVSAARHYTGVSAVHPAAAAAGAGSLRIVLGFDETGEIGVRKVIREEMADASAHHVTVARMGRTRR